jgi:RimJ/RimL family protein N-acetyltransferase
MPKPVQALNIRPLRGQFVALELLRPDHEDELRRAATPEAFRFFVQPDFDAWFARTQKPGEERITFVVRRLTDNAVVGSTSYFPDAEWRVEIGSTWYTSEARGTAVNPEAKLLLFGNAFEAGYHCVVLRTCSQNLRSRAAILKLGAKEDGILRAAVWMPPSAMREGYFRDSVFYSVLASEWPQVRRDLEGRLRTFK